MDYIHFVLKTALRNIFSTMPTISSMSVILFRNLLSGTGVLADPLAFIVAWHKSTYTNPYGEKLASKIFWSVMFKKAGLKFRLKMSKKYGIPFLFGKTPKSTTQEKRQDFLEMLSNMVQDGVAVINKEDAVEFVNRGCW